MNLHQEHRFEAEICQHLAASGWLYAEGDNARFDRAHGLFLPDLLAWLEATQPEGFARLQATHGTALASMLAERLRKSLNERGTLDVLRRGVEVLGLREPLRLAQFKPALALNDTTRAHYAANRLRVVRQVAHSPNHPGAELALVLFLNGIAVATAELESATDPHRVYDLRAKLDATGYYDAFEVDRVAAVDLDPNGTQKALDAAIAPVADRLLKRYRAAQQSQRAAIKTGDDATAQSAKEKLDALQLFKNDMGAFVRLYAFLSQIFDYTNTDIEKRFLFYKRLLPLLDFGRERDAVDLSKVVLTHHTLKSRGRQPMALGSDGHYKLQPVDAAGSGMVQEKQKAYLAEIIERVNGLFEGDLTGDDQLVYVNGVLNGKLLENPTLVQQATSNSKEQFANSPDLSAALLHAIMDALDAHTAMSTQALGSERVREGLKEILLGPVQLYEALRERAAEASAKP